MDVCNGSIVYQLKTSIQNVGALDLIKKQKVFKNQSSAGFAKIMRETREIACFAFFNHGSSQLGQLIHSGLNSELHRKVTKKLTASQQEARKCSNGWLLHWALCLV